MPTLTAHPVRRRLAAIAAATAAAAALLAAASPAAAQPRAPASSPDGARAVLAGTWGKAIEVPGIAALNTGGAAATEQMSCPSAGNCSAGGYYNQGGEVFVVSEVHGTWGKAKEVPGTAALNLGGGADFGSVSCASAGNCSAGGAYRDSSGRPQAFVVSQVHGTWGKAKQVPGANSVNATGAETDSVSCTSAGNCTAGGFYAPTSLPSVAFVASQVNGTWGKAKNVATALNTRVASVQSVSCASAGNCSAGGTYADSSGNGQAFVVSEVHGSWGKAKQVPGTATLNTGGGAGVTSVSCAAAGDCSAVGQYYDSSGHAQVFVASQANGTWATAKEVPGTAALNAGGNAFTGAVSCAAAGDCSAGGSYTDGAGHSHVFVVSQANGTWGKAREIPGTAALNAGGNAGVGSVSCAAGTCDAGGYYVDSSSHWQAFVVSQANGTWAKAKEVPGTAALNQGGFAAVGPVSCAPDGTCGAGGWYQPSSAPVVQAFVVNKS